MTFVFGDTNLSIILNKHIVEKNLSKTRKNQIKGENKELLNYVSNQKPLDVNKHSYIISRLRVLNTHNIQECEFKSSLLTKYDFFLFDFLKKYNYFSTFFFNLK